MILFHNMQNLFQKTHIENHNTNTGKKTLNIHKSVYAKLENFHKTNKIPHLIFHGMSGSGKRTIVNNFLNMIYETNKPRMKSNIMIVNCAHGKGIKFIREELKFFAKTNINSNNGTIFKTIVLINADNLTIDAQSALRRCIEQFSFNTRFFIIIENKHKLLKPILSRFCEIYIPEHTEDEQICNLHEISKNMNYQIQYTDNNEEWLNNVINTCVEQELCHASLIYLCDSIIERGLSCIDVIEWIKKTTTINDVLKSKVIIYFDTIRSEYRYEKMIMISIFDFLYLRSNKDLKSITEL
jgi:hypothetical protein